RERDRLVGEPRQRSLVRQPVSRSDALRTKSCTAERWCDPRRIRAGKIRREPVWWRDGRCAGQSARRRTRRRREDLVREPRQRSVVRQTVARAESLRAEPGASERRIEPCRILPRVGEITCTHGTYPLRRPRERRARRPSELRESSKGRRGKKRWPCG